MKINFNTGWKFWKEGNEEKKAVTLPYDAMLTEQRTPDAKGESASGYFPGGRYCYEKDFYITSEEIEKHITLEFEGVYKNAEVFLNGTKIYQAAYGYMPFFVCMDNYLQEGKNTILVKADNSNQPDSRWYTGAGIYRPVWLYIQEQSYIELEGVKVRTVSIEPKTVEVSVKHTGGTVSAEILNADGNVIASEADFLEDKVLFTLEEGELWCEETPYLYTAKVLLKKENKIVDMAEEPFGVRQVTWSPSGLFINGKETLLRGGCLHHDHGIVGAAANEKSEERRIRILKENGFNAIRSSHNPCSKAMLRACDKLGVYVMDELWDMWYKHKSKFDYAGEFEAHYKEDIQAMVRRDYNHPSVIMYSIGNEVSEPAEEKGVQLAKEMGDILRKLDDSRAVTGGFNLMIIASSAKGKGIYKEEGGRDDSSEKKMAGMNSAMFNMITMMVGSGMNQAANGKKADLETTPVLSTLDISGYNYASGRYSKEGKLHPERIVVGSETFPQDIAKNWEMVKKYPYLIGDFMWTAWDYIGEAGIGAWSYHKDAKGFNKPYPWLLGDTGAFDILGNPNGEAMLAKAVWHAAEKPLIGVQPLNHPGEKLIKASWRGTNAIPSWSWDGCEGNKAVVEVFFDAEKIELLLNGKSLGKKKVKRCKALFKTKFMPGTLEAVAYDRAGKEIGRNQLCSAAGNRKIVLQPEETSVKAGEIIYVNVNICGENGIVESNADEKIRLQTEGGELLGFGSANPRTEERFDAGEYTTYYGRAQAVIRAGEAGEVRVWAKGTALGSTEIVIKIEEN